MEPQQIQDMIDTTLRTSLQEHRTSMLTDMEKVFEKISGNSNLDQMDKISSILTGMPTFKRKSNAEQYKHNSKVTVALEAADKLILSGNAEESRKKIAEAQGLIAHRQKTHTFG
ncbi:uncharacterized protein LOC123546443 [Mercenaria mercenaria]|uniref:uncharacterized protein LOC123546443 n=1 Tax=Mercenaria mercenaria TaxID=6596 RepID=UPI00234E7F81|nr:uncharacterized protein LOC123546443 [Mercenaria mercenaria]